MTIRVANVPGLPADVEVRRSSRRRRSVSAYFEEGRTIVVIPERMTAAEAARHAEDLHRRLTRKRTTPQPSALLDRAIQLSEKYLPTAPQPSSVTWSTRQLGRWGSCTSVDGTIRLSSRLVGMPDYVIDDVIVHELCHLLVPDHGPRFQALMARYPDHERASAFLEGVEYARAHLPAERIAEQ